MYERESTLYAFTLQYLERLIAEMPDDKLFASCGAGANPPAWVIGHLAVCTDYAAGLLGLPMVCPKPWHKMFGPTGKPFAGAADYPPRVDMLAALKNGHERVTSALPNANPATLSAPHTLAILAGTPIKTNGELLSHLLTTHEAVHIGQLSAWRRQLGQGPLF